MSSLNEFLARKAEVAARHEAITAWHLAAYADGGIELPYGATETWVDANVWDEENWEIDSEKSLDNLAKIARYCADKGVEVEKDYSDSFSLKIEIPVAGQRSVTIRYSASREAVCTKKVVGTETIPEKIVPAQTKEIVEWECEPISLLAREKTS